MYAHPHPAYNDVIRKLKGSIAYNLFSELHCRAILNIYSVIISNYCEVFLALDKMITKISYKIDNLDQYFLKHYSPATISQAPSICFSLGGRTLITVCQRPKKYHFDKKDLVKEWTLLTEVVEIAHGA